MAFPKGQSGNPGGRKKAIGLSRAVRKSEGLKTWGMLLDIRDEKIREQKIEWEDGEPVTIDVVPSVKERREACKLILAYCWGQPNQTMDLDETFTLNGDDDANRLLSTVANAVLRGDVPSLVAGSIAALVAASIKVNEANGGTMKAPGKVRNGFVPHMRCAMMPLLQELVTDEGPFTDLPEKRRTLYSLTRDEMQNCQWLQPLLVAQINFQEFTPDGHLRHSSFVGLRSDKDPRQIVREWPDSVESNLLLPCR